LKYYFSIIDTHLSELLKEKIVSSSSTKTTPISINKPVAEHNVIVKDVATSVSPNVRQRKKKLYNISSSSNEVYYTPSDTPYMYDTETGSNTVASNSPGLHISTYESRPELSKDKGLNDFKLDQTKSTESIKATNTTETTEPTESTESVEQELKTVDLNDALNTTSTTDPSDELLLLYTDELLLKLNNRWDNEKINILVDMINFLFTQKTSSDYSNTIETFMIPIDKQTVKIIEESL
jgi:hypothetical protein